MADQVEPRTVAAGQSVVLPIPVEPAEPAESVQPAEPALHQLVRAAVLTVPGVHELAPGRHRPIGRRPRVPRSRLTVGDGVNDETAAAQTAIDVAVIMDYGSAIGDVGRRVRTKITDEVGAETELQVVSVNVDIVDVVGVVDVQPSA